MSVVLILAVAPTATFAQSFVCSQIRRGESATEVARRLTGDGRNTYRASFQIMNASSRFVPKSQYDRIRAGWRACVLRPAVVRVSSSADQLKAVVPAISEPSRVPDAPDARTSPNALDAAASIAATSPGEERRDIPHPVAFSVLGAIGRVDLTIVWLGAAMVVPWIGWRILDDYLARRKTASVVMRIFADRFITEFERPLVRYDAAECPVRSRLRWRARPGRFDILLAPGEGRRYPNLSDHKKNVEYDIARVLDVLADQSFVSGPLSTQAEWVVVPFHFKAGRKQTGETCISSF